MNKNTVYHYRAILASLLFLVFISPLSVANESELELKPFTTDGCSAFPDGTLKQNQLWLTCCTAHDMAYWQGGSYQQRKDADYALQSCVENIGEQGVAFIMLAGVRVGGTPFLPTTFRWGYGWPYPRFYGLLTETEQQQVKVRLAQLNDQAKTK
ncbi:hypothetical protein C2869_12860 [Saccharobesus litoralis]|uniref:Uncharacterized protein n=1 Tax=Saccharobesus litoralis TaxID=2172099 RepID=A0A2S0VSS9_9ALTE|nr:hypothetical protein [Saccharobesus litoralis]AWB67276.1 hypothetical protein C2869_12860 [Saccharobesus litoralis]